MKPESLPHSCHVMTHKLLYEKNHILLLALELETGVTHTSIQWGMQKEIWYKKY